MNKDELLRDATMAYVIDWPSRDIPDSLARAGIRTFVHGGPRPDQVDEFVVGEGGDVELMNHGVMPDRADFVYTYRPIGDLPNVIAAAQELGARAVWNHEPSGEARRLVEEAGLEYVEGPDLAEEVRRVRPSA